MNFLAHALLAGDADADRIGGLMGDFVKDFLPAGLPPDLASGVALHRAIDSFADRHVAAVGQAIDRMAVYRLRRANTLGGGIEEFLADPQGFEADFRSFLPDALAFSADWRAARGG